MIDFKPYTEMRSIGTFATILQVINMMMMMMMMMIIIIITTITITITIIGMCSPQYGMCSPQYPC